jgi:hypothetical protein
MSDLYDEDTALWSAQQAGLLRRIAVGETPNQAPDWRNIAEEIDSMGRDRARELNNRVRIIIEHLMKLEASPATEPRAGWAETIWKQRAQIGDLLDDSPCLRPTVPAVVERQIAKARKMATTALAGRGETPRVDLAGVTCSADQVLGDWLPE